ncbi:DUF4870 domain-containing protein [Streptomonospora algeriensis]|uniref:DUF4870 domain-containing protein n=1 Tax=Streptomonospora algeriensis TaxID=995084 RepID=A0ABW3BFA9_9ACTN
MNYQITIAVASIAGLGLAFLVVPFILWVLMVMGWVFLPAIAGFAALLGGDMRYPFTWRPVRDGSEPDS